MTLLRFDNPMVLAGTAIIAVALWISCTKQARWREVPVSLLFLAVLLRLGQAALQVYQYRLDWLPSLDIATTFCFWLGLIRLVSYGFFEILLEGRRHIDIPKITRDVVTALLYLVALFIILKQKTDVNLGSLLATSAVLSLVLGLALQDTLGNLFSGLALQLEKPYELGDWVSFDQYTGQVVGITWKSTLIKTRNNELIYVPNNLIFKSTIKNHNRPTIDVVTKMEIATSYKDPPNKVIGALKELIAAHPDVLPDPEPRVMLTGYGNFSINYQMVFHVVDFQREPAVRFELFARIWYLFRREGISIPYPVQEEYEREAPEVIAAEARKECVAQVAKRLSEIDLFRPLSNEARLKLAEESPLLPFGIGETIVRQGEEGGESLFVIQSGECDVWVESPGSRPERVATLKTGQVFGEMSLLTGEARKATIRAATDVEVVEIGKETFAKVLHSNPGILEALGEILAERQTRLKESLSRQADVLSAKAKTSAGPFVSRIKAFFGLK